MKAVEATATSKGRMVSIFGLKGIRAAIILLAISTGLSIATEAQSSDLVVGADLIIFNAKITTQNVAQREASAVAVKGGRVYAVGSDDDILSLKDNKTRLIDADKRRLIPGLSDAHIHVLNERNYNYNIRWDGVPTLKRALEMLSEQAARTPDGHWVKVIGGWAPHQFTENRLPTIDELNKAVPNRPLIVQYAYNKAFLNGPAMKAMGIGTPKFVVLPGAVLEKDKSGSYTGVITGDSYQFMAMETMVPQPSFKEEVSSLIYVINDLNRFGTTSVVDATSIIGFPQGHESLKALMKDNRLNVRFSFVDLGFGDPTSNTWVEAEIKAITKKSPISPGQNIHPDMEHGYEYEGMGEALRAELHDHENFDQSAIVVNPDTMRKYIETDVTRLIEKRIPFRMHLSYNENITPFLDALEKVNKQAPLDGAALEC